MKFFKWKPLSLVTAFLLGTALGAVAQTAGDYVEVENYLEPFAKTNVSGSSSWGDPSGDFVPSLGWSKRQEVWSPNTSSYKVSYTASSSGKEGVCIGNTSYQILSAYVSGGYTQKEVYDLLITPQVKGTLKFYLKPNYTTNSFVSFFKMHKQADGTFTFDAETDSIPFTPTEMTSTYTWYEQSLNVPGDDYEYIGIRLWRMYIDEFQAEKALVPVNKAVYWGASGSPMEGYSQYNVKANSDGTATFGIKHSLTNTGNVPIPPGHKIKLMRAISTSTPYTVADQPLGEVDMPQLEPGESADVEIETTFPVPDDVAVDSNGKIRFRVDFWEDYTGVEHTSSSDRNQVGVGLWIEIVPYQAIMSISYDYINSNNVSTSKTFDSSTKPINYGSFKGTKGRVFKVKNAGAADLVIEGAEKPDWVELTDVEFPLTLAPDEVREVTVEIGGEPGLKNGNVKFIFDGLSMANTIPVMAEVIGAEEYFADFESENALDEWYIPSSSTSWSLFSYDNSVRSANNDIWTIEPGVNGKCLANGRNEEVGHAIYSPKLTFEDGEKFSFYAAKRQMGGSYIRINVAYSPDRANWTELGTISVSNEDESLQYYYSSSPTTSGTNIFKHFSFEMPEGDYYIRFISGYSYIDNFHGGKLAEVGFDLISESASAGETAIVNHPLTFTANFKNLTPTAVEPSVQRVALYANGEVVATAAAKTIDAFSAVDYDFEYMPHVAGDTELHAVLTIGQEKFNSPSVTVKIQEEMLVNTNQIGNFSNKDNGDYETTENAPIKSYNYHSKSEYIYTAADLAELDGTKILKISYPYYSATGTNKYSPNFKVWMQNTTDTEPAKEDDKYVFTDTEEMTNVFSSERYDYVGGNGTASSLAMFEIVLDEPFVYTGQNLRIVVEAKDATSSAGSYIRQYFAVDKTKTDGVLLSKFSDTASSYPTMAATANNEFPIIVISTEKVVPPVTGTVKDTDGNPIPNAYVKAQAVDSEVYYDATTDDQGEWALNIVQNELTYNVTASAEGYYTSEATELNMEGENDIVLAATSGKFTVTVKANNAASTPLAGIAVSIKPELAASDDEAVEATTDDQGVATFEAMAYTDYVITVADAGMLFEPYESDEAVTHATAGDNADVVLTEVVFAPQSHTVAVTKKADATFDAAVTWSMGDLDDTENYMGYTFTVKADEGQAVDAETTAYTLTALSDKVDHTVTVTATSPYGTAAQPYTFTIATADLPWGDFAVTVTADNEDETPLEGVTVVIAPVEGESIEAVTDAEGIATFAGVAYGDYKVSVAEPGKLFEAYAGKDAVSHESKATSTEVVLTEIVHMPTAHEYDPVKVDDGIYSIDVKWQMGTLVDEDSNDLFGYTFKVQLDDATAQSVSEAAHTLTGVIAETEHTVTIVAVSPYGTEADAYTFTIPADELSGVFSIFGDENGEWKYYDLNGIEVKTEYKHPGVYILSNGKTSMKVLVK